MARLVAGAVLLAAALAEARTLRRQSAGVVATRDEACKVRLGGPPRAVPATDAAPSPRRSASGASGARAASGAAAGSSPGSARWRQRDLGAPT